MTVCNERLMDLIVEYGLKANRTSSENDIFLSLVELKRLRDDREAQMTAHRRLDP